MRYLNDFLLLLIAVNTEISDEAQRSSDKLQIFYFCEKHKVNLLCKLKRSFPAPKCHFSPVGQCLIQSLLGN